MNHHQNMLAVKARPRGIDPLLNVGTSQRSSSVHRRPPLLQGLACNEQTQKPSVNMQAKAFEYMQGAEGAKTLPRCCQCRLSNQEP